MHPERYTGSAASEASMSLWLMHALSSQSSVDGASFLEVAHDERAFHLSAAASCQSAATGRRSERRSALSSGDTSGTSPHAPDARSKARWPPASRPPTRAMSASSTSGVMTG